MHSRLRKWMVIALFDDFSGDDLLIFNWTVARTFFDTLERVDCVHAIHNLSEDRVVHVQPWSSNSGYEKLATVGAWTGICHRKETWLVEFDIASALVFEVLAPDGLAAAASAGWVATLDHEFFNDAVKDDSIVVAVLHMCGEVFAGLWCDVVEEFELN